MKTYIQRVFLALNIITVIHPIHAAETKIAASKTSAENTRTLLIFIDDQENEIGSITTRLLEALREKAAPILASTSLLYNIFITPELDVFPADNPSLADTAKYMEAINAYLQKPSQDVNEFLKKLNATFKDKIAVTLPHDVMLRATLAFNPDEWIIKNIPGKSSPSDYILLIPRAYLPELASYKANLKPLDPSHPIITESEFLLGLAIDHLPSLTSKDFLYLVKSFRKEPSEDTVARFMTILYGRDFKEGYGMAEIPRLFVLRYQYDVHYKKLGYVPVEWVIYLNGHGLTGDRIAWLPLAQFSDFLSFLDGAIKTKLFMYQSCYAAGKNIQELYKESIKGVGKTYSYPIITMALTDDVVMSTFSVPHMPFSTKDLDLVNRQINITGRFDFMRFVTAVQKDVINYEEVIESTNTTKRYLDQYFNLAQIRVPGLEWFNVLDFDKQTVTLGKTLARAHRNPLSVTQFFKREPRAILLETRSIPFELVIDTLKTKFIISMVPGNANHKFYKVSSPVDSLVGLFMKFIFERGLEGAPQSIGGIMTYSSAHKIYWIQELKAGKKSLVGRSTIDGDHDADTDTITNVIIDIDGKANKIIRYFTYNGWFYKSDSTDATAKGLLTSEDYMKKYTQLFDNDIQLTQEIAQQEQTAAIGKVLAEQKKS